MPKLAGCMGEANVQYFPYSPLSVVTDLQPTDPTNPCKMSFTAYLTSPTTSYTVPISCGHTIFFLSTTVINSVITTLGTV